MGMAVSSAVSYSVVCIALVVGLPARLGRLFHVIRPGAVRCASVEEGRVGPTCGAGKGSEVTQCKTLDSDPTPASVSSRSGC